MNHRKAILTATTALTILTAACGDGRPPTASSPASSPNASTPARTDKAPTYKLPEDICGIADPSGFQDLYPGSTPRSTAVDIPTRNSASVGICTVTLGVLESGIGLSVGTEIFTRPENAKEQYEFLRKRVFADYPSARDVTGLGDSAYSFIDDAFGGLRIVVLHGNAHNSIVVTKRGGATYPADTSQRLIAMARKMLSSMPRA